MKFGFYKGIITFQKHIGHIKKGVLNNLLLIIHITVAHREFKQLRFQPTLTPSGYVASYIWTV